MPASTTGNNDYPLSRDKLLAVVENSRQSDMATLGVDTAKHTCLEAFGLLENLL